VHRLAVFLSHPIQYYGPWFRHLAERLDLEVFYAHRQDGAAQARAGYGVEFEWDTTILDGYRHHWLHNVARQPSVDSFFGCDTPEVERIVASGGFDAAMVVGWNRKSSWQAIRACRHRGVPVLMRGDSHLLTPRPRWKKLAKRLPYRVLLPRLDGHLYVGQRNRAYLAYYGVPPTRLFFVPHCVDVEFFSASCRRAVATGRVAELRRELGVPAESFVFLFVGRLTAVKRPQDFIDACARLIGDAHRPEVHGVVVGDGPLRPQLEARVRARRRQFHFAGFRNQSELPAIYAAANALVLPSAGETWGLVVNEAMACGLPAIVSDGVGCWPDMIDPGRTGRTYAAGDVAALAAAMQQQMAHCAHDRAGLRRALHEKSAAYSLAAATSNLQVALEAVTRRGGSSVGQVKACARP
jgi:glycosyltransferase involved in cell wall biosynthesis